MIAIAAVGAFICLTCIVGVIFPAKLTGLAPWFLKLRGALWIAVVARLAIGALLIQSAPDSRFPLAFQILGWVMVVAALLIPFIGIVRLTRLVDWVIAWPPMAMRAWLILGFAFGAFLVYGTGLI